MIEKDNIKELFSKQFENHTETVRPDLWAGVQAKMAAAGVASTTVAAKGVSAMAKWLIGSAAVTTIGVVATVLVVNSNPTKTPQPTLPTQQPISQQTNNSNPILSHEISKDNPINNIKSVDPIPSNSNDQQTIIHSDNTPDNIPFAPKTIKVDPSLVSPYAPSYVYTDLDSQVPNDSKSKLPVDNTPSTTVKKESTSTSTNNQTQTVREKTTVDLVAKVTKFPNVFTPNGDGSNDLYLVEIENLLDFRLTIINEKNQVVFETSSIQDAWNGMIAGDYAPEGNYAAIVTGQQKNGKSFRDIQLFELKR